MASRDQNDGRGQIKAGPQRKGSAASSIGNLGLCSQGSARMAAAPCRKETRHALEYRCCFFLLAGSMLTGHGELNSHPK